MGVIEQVTRAATTLEPNWALICRGVAGDVYRHAFLSTDNQTKEELVPPTYADTETATYERLISLEQNLFRVSGFDAP